jgi:broad specificity phosphatase PhoE
MEGKTFYQDHSEKLGVPNRHIDLTPKGVEEAKDLAQRTARMIQEGRVEPPDVVLHSGFVRAKKTADIVVGWLGAHRPHVLTSDTLPVLQNHLLRERDSGYGFEMTEDESRQYFPYLRHHWDFEGKHFASPPGGESLVQVMDRATLLLHTLASDKRYQGKTIYAFTHGGLMMAIRMVVEGISFDEWSSLVSQPKNCQIDTYTNRQGYWETME